MTRSSKRDPAGGPEVVSACPVVAVGASSAGCADAFREFLGALPTAAPLALILAAQAGRSRDDDLVARLAEGSRLPVSWAEDGTAASAGTVHVIPPGRLGRLVAGRIALVEAPKGCSDPIDTLFTSLAHHNGASGCAVLLSGTGADGVQGLREVRGAGGVALVQDPSLAQDPAKPRAAIEAGVADFVGSAADIARELLAKIAHPYTSSGGGIVPSAGKGGDGRALDTILVMLDRELGMDFSGYKPTTVARRVSRRAMLRDAADMEEYLEFLRDDPAELAALNDDMLISVTSFFRDTEVFAALQTRVIPEILAGKKAGDTLRVWVPGCATGEEVYSLLITILEILDDAKVRPRVTIFGTDASERALKVARAGVYPDSVCAKLSPERLARFFRKQKGGYRVARELREMCVFARQDITRDTPFSRLDLVSLRNVLIYMDQALQKRVLAVAHYALVPSGILVLGTSETAECGRRLFASYDASHHIYRRKDVAPRLPFDVSNALRSTLESLAPAPLSEELSVFDVAGAAKELAFAVYAPPSVVVDADGQVVQFFGDTAPYLQQPRGKATFDVLELVRPAYLLELQEALGESAETSAPAVRELTFVRDGHFQRTSLEVTPIPRPASETYRLVAFHDIPVPPDPDDGAPSEDLAGIYEQREQRLRSELAALRGQIRMVAEEKDLSSQALRTANEEVRSSNEELQSINEELETAKEELQSANEELTTMNDELRESNRALEVAKDDVTNFMASTGIPVLMLDRDLRVRRFTPEATRIARIEKGDEGRGIGQIRLSVDVPDIEEIARAVIEKAEVFSRDVCDTGGAWWSLQARPYRSSAGSIDGAVLSFVDVDELKRSLDRVARRALLTDALARIDAAIASALQPDEILQHALDEGVRALGVGAGTIEMREGADWIVRYQHGFGRRDVGVRLTAAEAPIAEQAAASRTAFTITDMTGDETVDVGFVRRYGLKSVAAVPLIVRDEVTGCLLFFTKEQPRPFSRTELDFAERLGASVSLALENARLVFETQEANELSKALNRIDEHLHSTLDLDEVVRRSLKELKRALRSDLSDVKMFEGDGWLVRHTTGRERRAFVRLSRDEAPIAELALATGDAVMIPDISARPELDRGYVRMSRVTASLAVPLVVRERTVGAIFAQMTSGPRVFSEVEIDFARRLATSVSLALENARLFEAETRHANRMAVLKSIADVASSTLDVREVAQRIADTVPRLLGASLVTVMLEDESRTALVPIGSVGYAEEYLARMTPAPPDSEVMRAYLTGTGRWVEDIARTGVAKATRSRARDVGIRSFAMFPLLSAGRPIGTFSVAWPETHVFDAEEVAFLESFAVEVATGIQNARLYESESAAQRRAAEELETTTLLLDAATILAESSDLRSGLERLVDTMRRAVPGIRTVVCGLDETRHEFEVLAAGGGATPSLGARLPVSEMTAATQELVRAGRRLLIDFDAMPAEERGIGEWFGVHLMLAVPLVYQDRIVGVVVLDDPAEPRREFTEREIGIVEAFAAQAAAAIDNDRLFEAERRRIARLRTLQSLTELVTSSLDLDEVVLSGLTRIVELLDVAATSLWVAATDSDGLQLAGSHGFPGEFHADFEGGLAHDAPHDVMRAFVTGEPVVHPDAAGSNVARPVRDAYARYGIPLGSLIALPLQTPSGRIGGLTLAWNEPRPFTEEDLAFDVSIANAFAIALDNARLFQAEHRAQEMARRELETNELLLETADSLSSSMELEAALSRLTDVLLPAIEHTRMTVSLYDAERAEIRVVVSRGQNPVPPTTLPLEVLAPVAREALATKRTVVIDPGSVSKERTLELLEERAIEYALAVPMVYRDSVVGMILVDSPGERREFEDREIAIVEGVAAQAAGAVENRRLVEGIRRQATELDTVFKALPYPVQVHTGEGTYLRVNPAVLELFGFDPTSASREEIAGRLSARFPDGTPLAPENMPSSAALRGEAVRDVEYVITNDRGEEHVLVANAVPFVVDGQVHGAVLAQIDITARKAAEEALRKQNVLQSAVNRILDASLHAATVETLGEVCVTVAEELTGSGIGFVGALTDRGTFSDIAISDPGWTACKMYDQSGHRRPPGEFALHGIYGRVLAEGRGLYTNDAAGHPDSAGLPDGHPPIVSFLGVPLLSADQTFGMLAVANRSGGYSDEQLHLLEAIAPIIAESLLRRRAEDELSAANKRLDAHIANSPLAIIEFDAGFHITRWSDEAERVFGWKASEVLGKAIGDFKWVYEEDVALVGEESARLADGSGQSNVNVNRNYRKDGAVIWCEWYDSAIYDEQGELVSIFSQVLDVTARRTAEDALRDSERRLRTIIEELPIGITLLDGKGAVLEVNAANNAIWRGELPKAAGPDEYAIYHAFHHDTLEAIEPAEWPAVRTIENGEPAEELVDILRYDDTTATARIRTVPVKDTQGRLSRIIGITEDVTDELEQQRLTQALSDISSAIGSSLDITEIRSRLIVAASRALRADAASIMLRSDDRWVVSDVHDLPPDSIGTAYTDEQIRGAKLAFDEGLPVVFTDVPSDERVNKETVHALGRRAFMSVPLVARGRALGVIAFAYDDAPRISAPRVEFASKLMSVVTLALENAALYERERNIADTLQQAVLGPPETIEGLEVSLVYRAASEAANVGGDLYDVFRLHDGRAAVLIGDVSGKGLAAARLTSVVRDGVRAYAYENGDPAWVLGRLNTLVLNTSPTDAFATLFFGVIDPATSTMRYCSAGHPPPVISRADGKHLLVDRHSGIVGAFAHASFETHEVGLLPGDIIVLYTDGVTEARDTGDLFGEARLLTALRDLRDTPFAVLPDRLLIEILEHSGGTLKDDTVILCLRLTAEEPRPKRRGPRRLRARLGTAHEPLADSVPQVE